MNPQCLVHFLQPPLLRPSPSRIGLRLNGRLPHGGGGEGSPKGAGSRERLEGRFGVLQIQNEKVVNFNEKMPGDGGWINGGYFVLEPEVLDYIENDKTVWELDPLKKLANDENLSAYRHTGFWHPVDTLWDKKYLEEMWNTGNPKWKSW